MGTIVSSFLVIVALLFATPVLVFFIEILASVLVRDSRSCTDQGVRPLAAVLVPAHNEGSGILATLTSLKGQLLPEDRLLVIADNCSDDTAAVARAVGAEVVERNDPTKRGKGYALDWGVRHLASDPREIVIVVDADCELGDGAVDNLISSCASSGRPVQALYLMKMPRTSRINHQVAEFTWRVKNWLRPLGLRAINLPCQLMGTGMAFPWDVIRSADLANAELVEDLKLGLELTLAGYPPLFCPAASVTSEFASSVKGAKSQRQRWEEGHLGMILKATPRLLAVALKRRDIALLGITLDLVVPPLSLLGMLVLATFALGLSDAIFGHSVGALAISAASLFALVAATLLAWLKCGRDLVPLRSLPLMLYYVFGKIGLYRQIIFRQSESNWIGTDRTK